MFTFTSAVLLLLLLIVGRAQDYYYDDGLEESVDFKKASRLGNFLRRNLGSDTRRNLGVCDKVVDLRNVSGNRASGSATFDNVYSGHEYTPSCGRQSRANEKIFRHLVRPGETFQIRQSHNNFDSIHELSVGRTCDTRRVLKCTDDPDDSPMEYTNDTNGSLYVYFIVDAYWTGGSGRFHLEWEVRSQEQRWEVFMSRGSYGNHDMGAWRTNHNIKALPPQNKIIRRLCDDCTYSHKEIYYKRLTNDANIDYHALMGSRWVSNNNILNRDFKLYSTLEDARNDRNAWRFCNYDDLSGVGFPRDCGSHGPVWWQWNSFVGRRGSRNSYQFAYLQ